VTGWDARADPSPRAYGTTTYEYKPAGRLLTRTRPTDQVTTYDYDIVGNLRGVALPDTTEIIYGLDGPDRRVQRSVDDAITHRFLYNGFLPIAQLDELGNIVSRFVYAGPTIPVLMVRDGVNYRLVTDRVTGLVRFGFRDYDPEIGRWTAQDPVGFNGNDANLYRYVNNNPINFKDASGLSGWDTALGFLNMLNQEVLEAINPGLAYQHGIEFLGDYFLGDWLERNGFFRHPHPGRLMPTPSGVDPGDYADGEFYGSCTAALGSIVGGGVAGAPAIASKLGSLAGKLGSLAGKLKQLPGHAKRLSEGAKGLFRRGDPHLTQGADEVSVAAEEFFKKLVGEGLDPNQKLYKSAIEGAKNNRKSF